MNDAFVFLSAILDQIDFYILIYLNRTKQL
jgi:hypothetical protein